MVKKIGTRTNQKLLRRMHEVLLDCGPMTANQLSSALKTTYPTKKRLHHNAQILSQLMVGRPKRFEKVSTNSRCHTWGALPEVVE
jgi:hypothetical protein